MKIAYAIIDWLAATIVVAFVFDETGSVAKALIAMLLVALYGMLNFYQGITRRGKSQ